MKIILIPLMWGISASLAISPELEERFKDTRYLFDNIKTFYNLLAQDPENFDQKEFCERLEDFNIQKLNVKDYYYLVKAFEVLQCEYDKHEILKVTSEYLYSENLLIIYYAFNIHYKLKGPDFEGRKYCDMIEQFEVESFGQFTSKTRSADRNYYLTSIAVDLLALCSVSDDRYKLQIAEILGRAITGLKHVTKSTKAWLNEEHTFYTTIRLLNRLLEHAPEVLHASTFDYVMAYMLKHGPFKPSIQERTEIIYFEKLKRKLSINAVGFSDTLNLKTCAEKCKIKLDAFLPSYRAVITIGDDSYEREINSRGEILIETSLLQLVEAFKLKIVSDEHFVYTRSPLVTVTTDNAINIARMKVSSNQKPFDLYESNDSDCEFIRLSANQNSYIHVGVTLKRKTQFLFVYLKPVDDKLESSTPINAVYDPDNSLYVSTFDVGDYEVIRPNSGTYKVVIVLDNDSSITNEVPCGVIEIKFPNLRPVYKERLSSTYELQPVNFENKPLPVEPSVIIPLYVLVLCTAVIALYVITFNKYYLTKRPEYKNLRVAVSLGLLLFAILATIMYLGYRLVLIENILVVIAEIAVFSYMFNRLV